MTFMAMGDKKVSSNNSTFENDDECDYDLEFFVEKLYENLIDTHTKNKE